MSSKVVGPPVTRILIPATWDHGTKKRSELGEFKLGLGPCGRMVTRLRVRLRDGCFQIAQDHTEGPSKLFIYPLAQLTGRVEVEYAE